MAAVVIVVAIVLGCVAAPLGTEGQKARSAAAPSEAAIAKKKRRNKKIVAGVLSAVGTLALLATSLALYKAFKRRNTSVAMSRRDASGPLGEDERHLEVRVRPVLESPGSSTSAESAGSPLVNGSPSPQSPGSGSVVTHDTTQQPFGEMSDSVKPPQSVSPRREEPTSVEPIGFETAQGDMAASLPDEKTVIAFQPHSEPPPAIGGDEPVKPPASPSGSMPQFPQTVQKGGKKKRPLGRSSSFNTVGSGGAPGGTGTKGVGKKAAVLGWVSKHTPSFPRKNKKPKDGRDHASVSSSLEKVGEEHTSTDELQRGEPTEHEKGRRFSVPLSRKGKGRKSETSQQGGKRGGWSRRGKERDSPPEDEAGLSGGDA